MHPFVVMTPDSRTRLEEAQAKASYYQSQYEFLLGQIPNPTFPVDRGSPSAWDCRDRR